MTSALRQRTGARITHLDDVQLLAHTALVKGKSVYRSRMIPVTNAGGLQVRATSLNLLSVLNTGLARGAGLNPGTAREPVAVLDWAPRNGWASTGSSPTNGSGWEASGSTSQVSWNPCRWSPTSTTAP